MKIQIIDGNKHSSAQLAPPSASLPIDIHDWSKILKTEYREHGYLPRRRGALFSVHEGIKRTLKGRDLHRVRNVV
ncbi:hypothetical protein V6N13_139954 [Hibiscus sabdariffa]